MPAPPRTHTMPVYPILQLQINYAPTRFACNCCSSIKERVAWKPVIKRIPFDKTAKAAIVFSDPNPGQSPSLCYPLMMQNKPRAFCALASSILYVVCLCRTRRMDSKEECMYCPLLCICTLVACEVNKFHKYATLATVKSFTWLCERRRVPRIDDNSPRAWSRCTRWATLPRLART